MTLLMRLIIALFMRLIMRLIMRCCEVLRNPIASRERERQRERFLVSAPRESRPKIQRRNDEIDGDL